MFRRVQALVAAGVLSCCVTGCADDDQDAAPVSDPCPLISDAVLERLAPGAERTPVPEGAGVAGPSRRCEVSLESGTGSRRGDLTVTVSAAANELYDAAWRQEHCGKHEVKPARGGPGDFSCVAVTPFDGVETRVDGYAWVGDYEAKVAYQLLEPQQLPARAEKDMRDLLAAAVNSLPSRRG